MITHHVTHPTGMGHRGVYTYYIHGVCNGWAFMGGNHFQIDTVL